MNAEVIDEDAVAVGKSKFISLNGHSDAVKAPGLVTHREPEREESADGYAPAAAATATRLWEGFAPFIADKRERSRFGKVARKLLADSGMDQKECGRLAALDASAGEAEASRAVRGAERAVAAFTPPETPPRSRPAYPRRWPRTPPPLSPCRGACFASTSARAWIGCRRGTSRASGPSCAIASAPGSASRCFRT